jgi:uncharacterized membrane protein YqjE
MATPDSGSEARPPLSLVDSLKRYLGAWADALRTRLDLLTTEIEEERERTQQLVLLAAVSSLCLATGALLLTFFVVMLFWDSQYRLVVVGGFAVIYLAAGIITAMVTRQKSRERGRLLAATLDELAKDCQHLSS